jgi:hypothetical protein
VGAAHGFIVENVANNSGRGGFLIQVKITLKTPRCWQENKDKKLQKTQI